MKKILTGQSHVINRSISKKQFVNLETNPKDSFNKTSFGSKVQNLITALQLSPVFIMEQDLLLSPEKCATDQLSEAYTHLSRIQQLFSSYDSQNDEQTRELLEFIETNIQTGLHELEINIWLRPKHVKDYVYLYMNLSRNVRLLATKSLYVTDQFSYYLHKADENSYYESKLLSSPLDPELSSNLDYLYGLIFSKCDVQATQFPYEYLDHIIDDDFQFFAELSKKTDFDLKQIYLYNGAKIQLLQLACFYGARKIFKYFWDNKLKIDIKLFQTVYNVYALASGAEEIINLVGDSDTNCKEYSLIPLIFRHDNIYDWFIFNKFKEEDFNTGSKFYYFSETFSIRTLHSFHVRNPKKLLKCQNYLLCLVMDGINVLTQELSQYSEYNSTIFSIAYDPVTISNIINNADDQFINSCFNNCLENLDIIHLNVFLDHPKFNVLKIEHIIEDSYLKNFLITKINQNQSPKDLIKLHNSNFPLSNEAKTMIIKYYLDRCELADLNMFISDSISDFSKNELLNLLQLSPFMYYYLSTHLSKQLFTDDEFKYLLHFACFNPYEKINFPFKEDSRLDPIAMINLSYLKRRTGLLKPQNLNDIKVLINSIMQKEAYNDYITKNPAAIISILPVLIQLKIDFKIQTFSQEMFDKMLHYYIMAQLTMRSSVKNLESVLDYLLLDQNRQFVNLEKISEIFNSSSFYSRLAFTKEEFDYIKTINPDMRRLMNNLENVKYLTIEEIFELDDESSPKTNNSSQGQSTATFGFGAISQWPNKYKSNSNSHSWISNPFTKSISTRWEKTKIFNTSNQNETFQHNPPKTEMQLKQNIVKKFLEDFQPNDESMKLLLSQNSINDYVVFMVDYEKYNKYLTTDLLINALTCNKSSDDVSIATELFSRKLNTEQMIKIFELIPISYYKDLNLRNVDPAMKLLISIKTKKYIENIGKIENESVFLKKLIDSNYKFEHSEFLFKYEFSQKAKVSALFYAIEKNKLAAVEELINHGTRLDIMMNGKLPIEYAVMFDNPGVFNHVQNGFIIISKKDDQKKNIFKAIFGRCSKESRIFQNIKDQINPEIEKRYFNLKEYYPDVTKTKDLLVDLVLSSKKFEQKYQITKSDDLDEIKFNEINDIVEALYLLVMYSSKFREFIGSFYLNMEFSFADYTEKIESKISEFSNKFKNVYSVLSGKDMITNDEDNSKLLYLASRVGNLEIIKSLLEKGAELKNVEGFYYLFSPALEAVSKDRSDILELFIEHGLNVNEVYTSDQMTLINCSILYNAKNCFDILKKKADLSRSVKLSLFECCLIQYSRGEQYFANQLYELIDQERERIESYSFNLFEMKQMNFNLTYSVDFGSIGYVSGAFDAEIASRIMLTDIVQKNLAVHTTFRGDYESYTDWL